MHRAARRGSTYEPPTFVGGTPDRRRGECATARGDARDEQLRERERPPVSSFDHVSGVAFDGVVRSHASRHTLTCRRGVLAGCWPEDRWLVDLSAHVDRSLFLSYIY